MVSSDLISKFPLFKDLPADLLEKIAAISEEHAGAKDSYAFKEGEKADKLHFLIQGSIVLKVQLTSRPEQLTVSYVNKPYESFGWSGVVPPYHYTASALCEEDSKVMTISGDQFMELLEKYPEGGFKVMRRITEIVADRLRNSRQALLKTI